MLTVKIANQFSAWRQAARQLLQNGINPADVNWQAVQPAQFDWLNETQTDLKPSSNKTLGHGNQRDALFEIIGLNKTDQIYNAGHQSQLFEDNNDAALSKEIKTDLTAYSSHLSSAPRNPISLPKKMMAMLQTAARTTDEDRWAFLYRLVWRYAKGEHDAILPGDIDGSQLAKRVKSVHREIHHWQAFLRFKKMSLQPTLKNNSKSFDLDNQHLDYLPEFQISADKDMDCVSITNLTDEKNNTNTADDFISSHDDEVWIAWCEFKNYIIEPVAHYFLNRMGRAKWLIAAPFGLAYFDGKQLHIDHKHYNQPAFISDPIEALWRTYFSSTFNPSRSNPKLTKKHLPVRFWKHLPEGDLIPSLVADAANANQRHAQARALHDIPGSTIDVSANEAQPERKPSSDLNECRRCSLWENATQAVAGVGPNNAKLILIGEQPGDSEDLSGLPFVGPAGQVLNRALIAAGIKREDVYMTNAVKHFKWQASGQRRLHKSPAQSEINACRFWLEKELQRFPGVPVVTLGATALKAIMKKSTTLSSVLNQPFQYEGRWVTATYHPSYILRVPDLKLQQAAEIALVTGLKLAKDLSQ